jgi:hypothetical protein
MDVYEIRIREHLTVDWQDRFEGMDFVCGSNGEMTLRGPIVDQAALHGILACIRDLGLTLISFQQVEPGRSSEGD